MVRRAGGLLAVLVLAVVAPPAAGGAPAAAGSGSGPASIGNPSVKTSAASAGGAAPGTAAAAREAADRLRDELDDLQERSSAAISGLQQAEHEVGMAVARAVTLGHELDDARAAAGGTAQQLQRRVSALYRSGGSLGVYASLLRASDPADFAARMTRIDKVVATDVRLRTQADDDASRLAALEQQARDAAADTIRATGQATQSAAQVSALLAEREAALARADARVTELLERERREAAARELARLAAEQGARTSALPAVGGLRPGSTGDSADPYLGPPGACPVGRVHSFTDTWHANRSGGRRHQGADVFAPHGSPAYAVVDGVIDKWSTGGLGGIALWLRGDNGDRYYYAHNAANVARVGSRVTAGQLIAYVGTTGNAATTPPHVHFQAHPGGGAAHNPYPWLRTLCG